MDKGKSFYIEDSIDKDR